MGSSDRDALAGAPSCPRVTIEVDASFESQWPGLRRRVRDAIEAHEDVDRCARVILTSRERMIDVEVALPDGRSARRHVARSEDMIPALEALLIVPQEPATRADPSSPAAIATSASAPTTTMPLPVDSTAPTLRFVPPRDAPASTPAPSSSHLRIELSASMGSRIGDGQASVGLGALSFLDLAGWLAGFAGRVDRYETRAGSHSARALELALLGGRRLRFQTIALDLVAGPAVALGGTTTYQAQSPTEDRLSASASNTVPRLLVEARLAFAALSTVHTFVAVDGDFGPANSADVGLLPQAPRLPTWTAGLALGATVGTH